MYKQLNKKIGGIKMFETKDFDITEIIEDKLNEVVLTEKENTVEVEGMKAIEVHTFIDEKIKLLGRGKKVTISYLVKDDSENGYSEKTEKMDYAEMIDNSLYINVNVFKDGDIKKFDNVVSVCGKVLNIQLWVNELPGQRHIDFILKFKRKALERAKGWKEYYTNVLNMPFATAADRQRMRKYIKEYDIKIEGLEREIDEITNRNKCDNSSNIETKLTEDSLKVNNHTKLLDWYLDIKAILGDLKSHGFKGNENNLGACLVYALDATSFYVDGSELSEEEYFDLLVEQMNSVI